MTNDWRKPWPWTRFTATEGWAALVDENDWGLGVFKTDGCEFHGGIYGDGRSEDPKHGTTAYVAPIHMENFDHNIVYEHRTAFMVGKLPDIRKRFNQMAAKAPPSWRFQNDRQHWTVRDATDQGFPLNGAWRIKFGERKAQLKSGIQCWRAEDAPELTLAAAFTGQEPLTLRISWTTWEEDHQDEMGKRTGAANRRLVSKSLNAENDEDQRSLKLQLIPDGKFHTYRLQLQGSSKYRGLITGLSIEPADRARPGDALALQSILLGPEFQER